MGRLSEAMAKVFGALGVEQERDFCVYCGDGNAKLEPFGPGFRCADRAECLMRCEALRRLVQRAK